MGIKFFFNHVSLFFAIGIPLISLGNAYGQADSVKYRLLQSYLSDSSIFRYELGSICVTSLGTKKYLRFANDAAISTISSWFKTKSFTIGSHNDTVSFFRFASFDNKHDLGIHAAGLNEPVTSKWYYPYGDTEFIAKPPSLHFNYTSSVLYIVTLKKNLGQFNGVGT